MGRLAFIPLALLAAVSPSVAATAAPSVTYIVPAGQAAHESAPVLTGAGAYSSLSATYDRAAANKQPNRAALKGEAYLGDGGATVTYRIKKLAATPLALALWINYSDDAKHASGARDVDISIPQLKWSTRWHNVPTDTRGWNAVKVATVTTAGNVTIAFRKVATTSAAFTMNAFALTNAATAPPFNLPPAVTTTTTVAGPPSTYDGLWAGSYTGTLAGVSAAGGVAARVSKHVISVTAPINGTGTVDPNGRVQVSGALGALGVRCTYTGVLVVPAPGATGRPSVRSGSWTCTGPLTGSGTWRATRP